MNDNESPIASMTYHEALTYLVEVIEKIIKQQDRIIEDLERLQKQRGGDA